MAFTPLFDPRDVIINLETTLPREKIPPHYQAIECGHPNQSQKLRGRLQDNRILKMVSLHRPVDIIEQLEEVVHAESRRIVAL